ncbi:phosphatidate cytidylyltransferase [candidate division NPL-UPA2 bacterium]|nr:phosphatidate cytidylyltransferase [candidate division NPL-UPA2 bacterium]
MRNRLIVAIIFIPIFIILIRLGGWPFLILIAAISLAGLFEFYQLVRNKIRPLLPLGMVAGLVLLLSIFYEHGTLWPSSIIVASILTSFLWQMGRKDPGLAIANCGVTILGLLYVIGLLGYLISLRKLENGESLVLSVWFITWIGDSGAFAIGRPWGRHKLFPRISPNKTIEGAVGGVLSAMLASLIAYFALRAIFKIDPFPLCHALPLGFALGIIGILGDLSESLLKRSVELKDSGGKVPGHGGILDTFDSLLFTAPVMYYYAIFIMKL